MRVNKGKIKMNDSSEDFVKKTCHILGASQILITKIPSEKYFINNISAIVVNAVMIIPTISLNLVAIITIMKSSQLNSKPCYFIILVQSIIDLLVGVLGIPSQIGIISSWTAGLSNCLVISLMFRCGIISVLLSMIAIVTLTWERYIAIVHPYAYQTKVTKKKLKTFIIFGAVVVFILAVLSYINEAPVRLYTIASAVLTFLFAAFAYTRIYFVARKLARPPTQPQNVATENITRMKLFRQEIKIANPALLLLFVFFLSVSYPRRLQFLIITISRNLEEQKLWYGWQP